MVTVVDRSATVGPTRSATAWSRAPSKPKTPQAFSPEYPAEVLLGQAAEHLAQDQPVHRGRPFEVGVVGSPHQPVHADLLPHLGLGPLHQRSAQEHVAVDVLGRAHLQVGAHRRARRGCRRRTPCPGPGRAATARRSP